MLDTLPIDSGPLYRGNATVNFNLSAEPGSHKVAFKKKGLYVSYFDSYGDLPHLSSSSHTFVDEIVWIKLNKMLRDIRKVDTVKRYNCKKNGKVDMFKIFLQQTSKAHK